MAPLRGHRPARSLRASGHEKDSDAGALEAGVVRARGQGGWGSIRAAGGPALLIGLELEQPLRASLMETCYPWPEVVLFRPKSKPPSMPSMPSLPPGSNPGWEVDAVGFGGERSAFRPHRRFGRWAALLGLAGLATLAGAALARLRAPITETAVEVAAARGITLDEVEVLGHARLAEQVQTLDEARGFNECFLPDPAGLGPYAPYQRIRGQVPGRIAIPQRGGHTADLGFDVVVHFHGGDAVRKRFVPSVTGAVFVAIDLGLGSGAYSEGLAPRHRWGHILSEIHRALRVHTGDERAHVRHLALTSWSAGYGAVNEILKRHGDAGIEAVVLLDSMHVGQNLARPRSDESLEALSADSLRALFDFAAKAVKGEKTFVLTHSNIVPAEGYASVRRSADLLLHELGLERTPQVRLVGLMDQLTTVDRGRLHVWGFEGRYERAHCAHTTLLGPIVHELLEREWATPPMNRDVPPTPAPRLGDAS